MPEDPYWNLLKPLVDLFWDEGDIFDPSAPPAALPASLALEAHACINPGSLSQGKACIGTNHCEEGLTCKGFPFWSICVP
jgi:hypothetical protein